ncbi:hypothetical protein BDQ12DRAFT_310300 [Crucibulum laeve]|uniref:Uncharacterized protein n=1 Tax=Crucibulum laeve TaxID=68775 RepID=A0A5C3LTX3_9AGAR|nr:hypothetical protein BDQ12DRAFT_310300 [Crucibulum laeve]
MPFRIFSSSSYLIPLPHSSHNHEIGVFFFFITLPHLQQIAIQCNKYIHPHITYYHHHVTTYIALAAPVSPLVPSFLVYLHLAFASYLYLTSIHIFLGSGGVLNLCSGSSSSDMVPRCIWVSPPHCHYSLRALHTRLDKFKLSRRICVHASTRAERLHRRLVSVRCLRPGISRRQGAAVVENMR